MPSSCKDIRQALADCLQESECIMVQRHTPRECLGQYHDELPVKCQQLKKGLSDCKRGLVDMRKRFRGNYPVGLAKETGKTNDGYQLYAGKPAYQPVKKINGDEVEMDPEKTRGL